MSEDKQKKKKIIFHNILNLCIAGLFIIVVAFIILTTTTSSPYFSLYESYHSRERLNRTEIFSYQDVKNNFSLKACNNLLPSDMNKEFKNDSKDLKDTEKFKNCLSTIKTLKDKSLFKIVQISNMKMPRVSSESIKLNDGNVLIIGGDKNNQLSAELFDHKTQKFKLITDNLNQFFPSDYNCKYLCKPLLLSNGDVYFKGSIYNASKEQFQKAKSPLRKDIIEYDKNLYLTKASVINVFQNGNVLLAKNCQDSLCSNVQLEDPFNKKKYNSGELKFKNWYFASTDTGNNRILLFTLHSGPASLNIYNYDTGKITNLKEGLWMTDGNHPIMSLEKDKFLFPTGDTYYLYNLKHNKFRYLVIFSRFVNAVSSFKEKYILFTSDSIAYITDYINEETTLIFNTHLSFKGQTFTPLDNGDVLITGGKIIYTEKETEYIPSDFAAILKSKK